MINNLPLRPGGDPAVSVSAHIRREDLSDAVAPLDRFIAKLEELVHKSNAGKLVIATNGNKEEIHRLKTAFPYAQIRCGLLENSDWVGWCKRLDLAILIEQVTAARCTHFVGTFGSTFTDEIIRHRHVMMGNLSFTVLKK